MSSRLPRVLPVVMTAIASVFMFLLAVAGPAAAGQPFLRGDIPYNLQTGGTADLAIGLLGSAVIFIGAVFLMWRAQRRPAVVVDVKSLPTEHEREQRRKAA